MEGSSCKSLPETIPADSDLPPCDVETIKVTSTNSPILKNLLPAIFFNQIRPLKPEGTAKKNVLIPYLEQELINPIQPDIPRDATRILKPKLCKTEVAPLRNHDKKKEIDPLNILSIYGTKAENGFMTNKNPEIPALPPDEAINVEQINLGFIEPVLNTQL